VTVGRLWLKPRGSPDCLVDELLGFLNITPVVDTYPFVGFEVFVVLEEVLDLIGRDRR